MLVRSHVSKRDKNVFCQEHLEWQIKHLKTVNSGLSVGYILTATSRCAITCPRTKQVGLTNISNADKLWGAQRTPLVLLNVHYLDFDYCIWWEIYIHPEEVHTRCWTNWNSIHLCNVHASAWNLTIPLSQNFCYWLLCFSNWGTGCLILRVMIND